MAGTTLEHEVSMPGVRMSKSKRATAMKRPFPRFVRDRRSSAPPIVVVHQLIPTFPPPVPGVIAFTVLASWRVRPTR